MSVVPHLTLKPVPTTITAVHCHGVDYVCSIQVEAISLSTESLRRFADAIVGTTVNLTPILFSVRHIVKLPVVRLPARVHQGRPSSRGCHKTLFFNPLARFPSNLSVRGAEGDAAISGRGDCFAFPSLRSENGSQ